MSFELGPAGLSKLGDVLSRAVADGAEHLLEQANRSIPIDTGALQRSGQVTARGLEAAVSYDTPYAARQHEDTRLRHENGRKAKWLEDTFTAETDTVFRFMADTVRKAFT